MKGILPLILSSVILLSPIHSDVKITEPPFYRGTTVQENEIKSQEEKASYLSLIKTISISPTKKEKDNALLIIPDEIQEYITLYYPNEKEKSKQPLTMSILASGKIDLLNREDIRYNTKLEVFLNSPFIDYTYNYGNRLYLSGGFLWDGNANIGKLLNNPSEIYQLSLQENNFFANAYIIVDSPFSEQCLILNVGIDNLLKRDLSESNITLSSTFEFPATPFKSGGLEKFLQRPYTTINLSIPLNNERPTISARAGIKMRKENDFMILYGQLNYNDNWPRPLSLSAGIKVEN